MGGTRALLTVRDAGGKTLYVNTMECAQLYMALWKPVEMPMNSFPDEISQCASTIEAGLRVQRLLSDGKQVSPLKTAIQALRQLNKAVNEAKHGQETGDIRKTAPHAHLQVEQQLASMAHVSTPDSKVPAQDSLGPERESIAEHSAADNLCSLDKDSLTDAQDNSIAPGFQDPVGRGGTGTRASVRGKMGPRKQPHRGNQTDLQSSSADGEDSVSPQSTTEAGGEAGPSPTGEASYGLAAAATNMPEVGAATAPEFGPCTRKDLVGTGTHLDIQRSAVPAEPGQRRAAAESLVDGNPSTVQAEPGQRRAAAANIVLKDQFGTGTHLDTRPASQAEPGQRRAAEGYTDTRLPIHILAEPGQRRAAAEDSDANDSTFLAAADTCTLAENPINHVPTAGACPVLPDDLTMEQLQRVIRNMQDFRVPEHAIRPYREALATRAAPQELHFRGAPADQLRQARLHLAS